MAFTYIEQANQIKMIQIPLKWKENWENNTQIRLLPNFNYKTSTLYLTFSQNFIITKYVVSSSYWNEQPKTLQVVKWYITMKFHK